MDFGTRRAVNEMLNRRDERARLREQARRGQFIPSDSESEPDEEYLRRKRPRVGPRFDGDPDDPDGDADDPHDEEDNVLDYETLTKTMEFSEREHKRLRDKIQRVFRRFLKFHDPVDPSDPKSEGHYLEKLRRMAEANSQTLAVKFQAPGLLALHPGGAMLCRWLAEFPAKILPLLEEVAKGLAQQHFPTYRESDRDVFVRFEQFPVEDDLRDLRCEHVGQFVHVKGVVTKRSGVYPELKSVYYNCIKCDFVNGPYAPNILSTGLKRCAGCQSRGPFYVNKEMTIYQDYQRITLQESPSKVPAGRMPRSKEVHLTADLVDTVRPGDDVDLYGIYLSKEDRRLGVNNGFPVFHTYIQANNVQRRGDVQLASISDEDIKQITDLARQPGIVDKVKRSIAPSIYGELHMKTALACAMFGAVPHVTKGKHRIRGDMNVLIMGDPGLAKSQCLKYVHKTFERSVFTTGKGASGVGLTAAVMKDRETGEWTLEGGALVLADSGICLIDEFDKMNDQDRTSIHEAMEQQSISVSKAGIITTLSARCAVVAAANPIGGKYDPALTFSENVDLTDPILSRFDLICVMRDEVDPEKDHRLADFVVCSHMRSHPTEPDASVKPHKQERSDDIIDQELLKKYIMYARTSCFPSMASIDQEKIARVYAELRDASFGSGGVPMTVRHLESLVRIAQAHARIELRDYVNQKDVDNAIATTLECFFQTQKQAIGQKLRARFSKFMAVAEDQSNLIRYLLEKEFKRVFQIQAMMTSDGAGEVHLGTFFKIVDSADLKHQAEAFIGSEAFARDYELTSEIDDPHCYIARR